MEPRRHNNDVVERLRHAARTEPPDLVTLETWIASYGTHTAQRRALRWLITQVQGLTMDWTDVWLWCWAARMLREMPARTAPRRTEAAYDR